MSEDASAAVIVGAGGHASVVAEAIDGVLIVGHLAPRPDPSVPASLGRYLGGDDAAEALAASGHTLVLGTGFVDAAGAARRARLLDDYRQRGLRFATVCHPTAIVSPTAALGSGVFVGARAVVGPGVRLGAGVVVNTGAIIDHDCRLAENVHVAPGATLSGNVVVGMDTLVGTGASIRHQISIGCRSVIGVGAAVVSDVSEGVTVVGVPARQIGGPE